MSEAGIISRINYCLHSTHKHFHVQILSRAMSHSFAIIEYEDTEIDTFKCRNKPGPGMIEADCC